MFCVCYLSYVSSRNARLLRATLGFVPKPTKENPNPTAADVKDDTKCKTSAKAIKSAERWGSLYLAYVGAAQMHSDCEYLYDLFGCLLDD